MGRYNLNALRVHEHAKNLLNAKRLEHQPPWMQALIDVPPTQSLIRTRPIIHKDPARKKKYKHSRSQRLFQPQQVSFKEDNLRVDFFGDHPWELARPRVFLEDDGKDYQKWDWSKPYQTGRPLNGESVVQRQNWLMQSIPQDRGKAPIPGLPKAKAYDQARKELYDRRHYDEIEQRVQKEEAMSTGAYFNKGAIEIGMELENKKFEQWKVWAQGQVTLAEQARSSAYTGVAAEDDEEENPNAPQNLDDVVDAIAEDIPASKRGQQAAGGAAVHP